MVWFDFATMAFGVWIWEAYGEDYVSRIYW